jgi:hypothetical protein
MIAALLVLIVTLGSSCLVPPPEAGPDFVWPISGTTTPDGPLSSTFGPRLKASEGDRYDFHRGIDIPAPLGTAAHAIADGRIRIGGSHPSYSDMIVQVEHAKESGGLYYSNYIHLSESLVTEDQIVEAGDIIGRTGLGASGFPHLHFEIRDEDLFQQNAINPFTFLPYADISVPTVTIDEVDLSIPDKASVTATVTLPRAQPQDELDFNAVTVSVLEMIDGHAQLVDEHSYDMEAWNLAFTPLPPDDAHINMDDPDFNGVNVSPEPFGTASESYIIHFTFSDLNAPQDAASTLIRAVATDVMGGMTEDEESGQ